MRIRGRHLAARPPLAKLKTFVGPSRPPTPLSSAELNFANSRKDRIHVYHRTNQRQPVERSKFHRTHFRRRQGSLFPEPHHARSLSRPHLFLLRRRRRSGEIRRAPRPPQPALEVSKWRHNSRPNPPNLPCTPQLTLGVCPSHARSFLLRLRRANKILTVSRRLHPIQLRILPGLRHQLVMTARFNHARPIQHYDEIGHTDRTKAVRDQDRNAAIGGSFARG